jgi:internalin A
VLYSRTYPLIAPGPIASPNILPMASASNLLPTPLKVFVYYKIDDILYADEVRIALSNGTEWKLFPDILREELPNWGEVWDQQIQEADVFIPLLSNRMISSPSCREELSMMINRAREGKSYLLPLLVETPTVPVEGLYSFQYIPKEDKPLTEFKQRDEIYLQVADQLTKLAGLKQNPRVLEILKANRSKQDPVLELTRRNLDHIPADLIYMPWIERLDLSRNRIAEIENIDNLSKLQSLNLSHNWIRGLQGLPNLEELHFLDLEENQLKSLQGIEKLHKLDTIGLSSNQIEDISPLKLLPNLKSVYLARNGIAELSPLASLPKLQRIVLTENKITTIRTLLPLLNAGTAIEERYSFDPQEKGIFVKGNPISDIPPDILKLGTEAVIDHFEKTDTVGTQKLEILKVILIGNSGVGKTNFSQYLRGEQLNQTHESTHVLDIKPWRASFLKSDSGELMLVNIFDFGGQDYYHDLHPLYYSHDTAYVLLWDTSTNHYDEVSEQIEGQTTVWFEHYPLTYWLESISYCLNGKEAYDYKGRLNSDLEDNQKRLADLAATAPILVLQNKIDESRDGYPAEGLLDQNVLQNRYPNIVTFYNLSLRSQKRLSALDDVLDACFGKLNLSGRLLIRTHHQVISRYIREEVAFEVHTMPQFTSLCQAMLADKNIILDEKDARSIASVLTNLGYVYFRPTSVTSNPLDREELVFTRLDMLNELIKDVMDTARRFHKRGTIGYDQLRHIPHIDQVLTLLVDNNSLIQMPERMYLAPQFLPMETDQTLSLFLPMFGHCNVRYNFTAYFHKSLITNLFNDFILLSEEENKTPNRSVGYHYWRRGLMLSEEIQDVSGKVVRNQSVFVHLIKEKDRCLIEIRTLQPFNREIGLEGKIESKLDELVKGWTVSKEVSLDTEHFFAVDELLRKANQKTYSFYENGKDYSLHHFKNWVNLPNLPKKLFVSYSSRNSAFMQRFITHLEVLRRNELIVPWYDRQISPGSKWDDAIKQEMEAADIIVFLLSPDFLATEYIRKEEIPMAIQRASRTNCLIFPVEILPCYWEETELSQFQQNLKPGALGKETIVISQADNDGEWKIVVKKLREVLSNT